MIIERNRSRSAVRRGAVAALAVAAALAGCGRAGEAATEAADDAVLIGAENVLVAQAEEISSGPLLSGTLRAEREAQVRAEVGGVVLQVLVDRGDPVRAGQPLARIEDVAVREAHASAQAAVGSAEAALDAAARNAERTRALAEAGALADRDVEGARTQLAGAQAQLAGARAQLSQAEKMLSRTVVRAPIAGVVSARPVSAGDVVQPGMPLFTVMDPASMRLEGSVPAGELGLLKPGLPVRFTVTGYPGRQFAGAVHRISPAADAATRQVPVQVTIPNDEGALVSGLYAEGRVQAETRQGVAVPLSAVDERGAAPEVAVLRGGRVARVRVTLGLRDTEADRLELTSGVAPGDTLLVGAALGTSPGTAVRVRGAAAAQP
jgi:membrane fusion protein, multidrug efflux system